jgi:hypothetical protein
MSKPELDALYDRVARGLALPDLPDATAAALLDKARVEVEDDKGDWDAALRVAATLGGWRAANLLRDAVRAGPFERSALALEWAPYAARDGVAALCQGLELEDEALLLQSLSLLSAHQVAAGTSRARRLLDHDSAAVRAAAASYLGLVAGPAVFADLKPLLGDSELGQVAKLALARLDGEVERPEPAPWPGLDLEREALALPAHEALPTDLPEEPGTLLSLLARVSPQDEVAVVQALQAVPEALLAALIRPLVPTSPSELAVGGCRYARLVADPRWRLPVRRLLAHSAPRVRLAAAQALEAFGGAVDLFALERAAADPVPQVAEAVAAALTAVRERES